MSISHLLHFFGSIAAIVQGTLGLLKPSMVASMVGIEAVQERGLAEVRSLYGTFFIGLGVSMLLVDESTGYAIVGFSWLGAAVTRLISILFQRSRDKLNYGAFFIEFVIALMLII